MWPTLGMFTRFYRFERRVIITLKESIQKSQANHYPINDFGCQISTDESRLPRYKGRFHLLKIGIFYSVWYE